MKRLSNLIDSTTLKMKCYTNTTSWAATLIIVNISATVAHISNSLQKAKLKQVTITCGSFIMGPQATLAPLIRNL